MASEIKIELLPVPPPGAYSPGTPWKIWKKSLDIYLLARKVTNDEDKVLVLLQCIGQKAMEFLLSACEPDEPEKKSWPVLLELLAKQYDKAAHKRIYRVELLRMEQRQDEPVRNFWTRLMDLAAKCEYDKAGKDEALALAFIKGINCNELRSNLLNPANIEKSSEALLEVAEAWVMSKALSRSLAQSHGGERLEINAIKGSHGKCQGCGRSNHRTDECHYKGVKCRRCHKRGHLERMCQGRVAGDQGIKGLDYDSDPGIL